MVALVLTAKGQLSLAKAAAAGLLIGLAGMMTLKALFYAPCFCGLLWLRYAEAENKRLAVVTVLVTILASLCSFAAIYLYHTARLAAPPAGSQTPLVMRHLPWFSAILPRANYIGAQILLAPIFFLALIFIPKVLRGTVIARPAKVALLGLLLPLVVLLFYRNTFPYFFVFILAPAAVALAPVFGLMRARIGNSLLAVLLWCRLSQRPSSSRPMSFGDSKR